MMAQGALASMVELGRRGGTSALRTGLLLVRIGPLVAGKGNHLAPTLNPA